MHYYIFIYTYYLSIRDHCLLFWKKSALILCNIFSLAFLNVGFMLMIFFIRDNTFGGKIIPYTSTLKKKIKAVFIYFVFYIVFVLLFVISTFYHIIQ